MTSRLQQRRDTAANWTSNNPTLAAGEIGFETDTGKFKIGTGSTAWASLAYASVIPGDLAELAQDQVDAVIVAGTGIQKTYDDPGNSLTLELDTTYVSGMISTAIASAALDTTDDLPEGTSNLYLSSSNLRSVLDANPGLRSQGVQGITGAQGPTGTQGTTGSTGAQGATGSTGAQGTTGATGSQGTQGTDGSQGTTGAQGTQGTEGIQGVQGIQGNTGASGVSSSYYNYRADTGSQADSAPSSGYLRWNNATQTSATYLYVNHLTDTAVDIDVFLAILKIGRAHV